MTRRAYIYFVATFLLGVVVGGAGVLFYAWNTGHWRRRPSTAQIVRRLTRDLNLSAPQVEQLKQIVDDSEKKMKELRTQARPQFDAIREEGHEQIRKILNPEQLEKFNETIRRHEERRRRSRAP
ncbi:MAG: periplasmic heavy metal sensor [Acidobacteria bacterium]|nr:periplasmic heavy metal sensor [Acidobacteriota bacterium]